MFGTPLTRPWNMAGWCSSICPPGTERLFPMYDIVDTRHRNDVALRGMRLWGEYSVGFVKDCSTMRTSSIRGIC